jgi:hypothetical protein
MDGRALQAPAPDPHWIRNVHRFIAIFALLITWALTNPMFAAPDEDLHLARTQSTWLGDMSPPYSTDGVPVGAANCFKFQPTITADCMTGYWGSETNQQLLPSTDGYPPVFYFIAGAPTRLVDDLDGAYITRSWLAFLCALVVAAALRRLSDLRPDGLAVVATVVALTPMSIFLMSTINPSGLSIAFGTLAVAAGLTWRRTSQPRELAILGLSIGAIVLLRRDGLIIGSLLGGTMVAPRLPALTSTIRCRNRRLAAATAIALVAALAFLSWSWDFISGQLSSDFSLEHGRLTVFYANHYLHQLVGIFGWLDTLVTGTTRTICFVTMSALVGMSIWVRDRRSLEGVFLLTSCCALPLAFGFFRAQYFQTRYVLPLFIAGFVLLVVLHVPDLDRLRQWTAVRRFLLVGVFVTHFTAFLTNMHRYSHGESAEISIFTEPAWEPPHLGYFASLVAGLVATALFTTLISWRASDDHPSSATPQ